MGLRFCCARWCRFNFHDTSVAACQNKVGRNRRKSLRHPFFELCEWRMIPSSPHSPWSKGTEVLHPLHERKTSVNEGVASQNLEANAMLLKHVSWLQDLVCQQRGHGPIHLPHAGMA